MKRRTNEYDDHGREPHGELHYDVVIIGPGFGGSVATLRAAEKGPNEHPARPSGGRPEQPVGREKAPQRPTGLAALAGAVSLAATLALPLTTNSAQAFPQQNLIIFITFGVILDELTKAHPGHEPRPVAHRSERHRAGRQQLCP